jgi:hypothetical protein
VAARCDTGANACDGKIWRWEFDEVDHGHEPELGPSAKASQVGFDASVDSTAKDEAAAS